MGDRIRIKDIAARAFPILFLAKIIIIVGN